tara:strand:- start:68 stop:784 length:717 start_codon:yes stop_codon:yes gene_type:complete
LGSIVIKNWDNKTWLSSNDYIKSFNQFLLKNTKLNSNSIILDIGCSRGKILGNLSSHLRLRTKPIGIDLINHKDKDKRIKFKKIDGLSFFSNNDKKFDLILIKQTIHLFSFYKIKRLIYNCKKSLNPEGVILIFTLDPNNNELPLFKMMKKKLIKSLMRDKLISKLLHKLNPEKTSKNFVYKVKISKKKYLKMIQNKFISILCSMSTKEILHGIDEIDREFNKMLNFNDNLVCIILKK